jgi:hypothetical protein
MGYEEHNVELAWAAGFYDGEGHTRVSNNCVRMALAQIEPSTLCRFVAAVGVGKVRGPFEPSNPNSQPIWRWDVSGANAREVFDKLAPFLSGPKWQQAQEAFSVVENAYTKLSTRQRQEIFSRFRAGEGRLALSSEFKVHPATINKVVKRLAERA